MDLADRLQRADTRRELPGAAEARYSEAEQLAERGHGLASIYLHGYAVEITLVIGYFSGLGYTDKAPISLDARRIAIQLARQRSSLPSEPHPIDGWAILLAERRGAGYHMPFAEALVDRARSVWRHWRPSLRYRSIDVEPSQIADVRLASGWISKHRGQIEGG